MRLGVGQRAAAAIAVLVVGCGASTTPLHRGRFLSRGWRSYAVAERPEVQLERLASGDVRARLVIVTESEMRLMERFQRFEAQRVQSFDTILWPINIVTLGVFPLVFRNKRTGNIWSPATGAREKPWQGWGVSIGHDSKLQEWLGWMVPFMKPWGPTIVCRVNERGQQLIVAEAERTGRTGYWAHGNFFDDVPGTDFSMLRCTDLEGEQFAVRETESEAEFAAPVVAPVRRITRRGSPIARWHVAVGGQPLDDRTVLDRQDHLIIPLSAWSAAPPSAELSVQLSGPLGFATVRARLPAPPAGSPPRPRRRR